MRYTRKDCEQRVATLNRMMGRPAEPYKRVGNRNIHNVGHLDLSEYNGYYRIVEIVNESGAERDIFGSSGLKAGDFCTATGWMIDLLHEMKR